MNNKKLKLYAPIFRWLKKPDYPREDWFDLRSCFTTKDQAIEFIRLYQGGAHRRGDGIYYETKLPMQPTFSSTIATIVELTLEMNPGSEELPHIVYTAQASGKNYLMIGPIAFENENDASSYYRLPLQPEALGASELLERDFPAAKIIRSYYING